MMVVCWNIGSNQGSVLGFQPRLCRAPPEVRSASPQTLFPCCFWAQKFELHKFGAVCRALARAQKIQQNPGKTPIFPKSNTQCVNPAIFQKSMWFLGLAAFSARLQALGKQLHFPPPPRAPSILHLQVNGPLRVCARRARTPLYSDLVHRLFCACVCIFYLLIFVSWLRFSRVCRCAGNLRKHESCCRKWGRRASHWMCGPTPQALQPSAMAVTWPLLRISCKTCFRRCLILIHFRDF